MIKLKSTWNVAVVERILGQVFTMVALALKGVRKIGNKRLTEYCGV